MRPGRALIPLLVGLLVVVAAGCGGSSAPKPYTAAATAACLKQKGFTGVTTAPSKIGFIASFAPNGGLRAQAPHKGDTVVMAFADDTAGAASTKQAYRRHAPKGLHINDVMFSQRNAVLVWTVTPSSAEETAALACLKS